MRESPSWAWIRPRWRFITGCGEMEVGTVESYNPTDQPHCSKEPPRLETSPRQDDNQNTFTVTSGYVMVNAVRYEHSLCPSRSPSRLAVAVDTLRKRSGVHATRSGNLLLGRGKPVLPPPAPPANAGATHVGVEVMDTRRPAGLTTYCAEAESRCA